MRDFQVIRSSSASLGSIVQSVGSSLAYVIDYREFLNAGETWPVARLGQFNNQP